MKAYKIMLFLLILNASFWMLQSMGIWGQGVPGQAPTGMRPGGGIPVVSDVIGMLGGSFGISSLVSAVGVISAIIISGAGVLTSKAPPPQAVGAGIFGLIFWISFDNTVQILYNIQVPEPFIITITGLHFFIAAAGMIQLATGAIIER